MGEEKLGKGRKVGSGNDAPSPHQPIMLQSIYMMVLFFQVLNAGKFRLNKLRKLNEKIQFVCALQTSVF